MMNILNRLYIHPFTYILFFLSLLTGMFKEFIMVFFIVIVHEFGHLLVARCFKWKTGKIKIYPFGGCCSFNEDINKPIKEELLILLSGPIFQIICFLLIAYFGTGLMTFRNYKIFKSYHYTLLFFNLLPIYPLDGGRIVSLIFYYFVPYKKNNKFIFLVSILVIILMLFFYKDLNFVLMMILLLIELVDFIRKQDFLYNRFLLERYLNNYEYSKEKIINNKNNMYKEKRHIILYNNKYITEKDYLRKRFKVKR